MTKPEVKPVLLVVGAAPGSLGEAVATEAYQQYDFAEIITAGISGEQLKLDVNNRAQIHERFVDVQPDHVVCTVGVNEPASVHSQHLDLRMYDAFRINVLGPISLLQEFVNSPIREAREGSIKKFVAISSNSARIPRSTSMAYCASKAALSMALRVAARELAAGGMVQVWGYEPGLLAGTPMTEAVAMKLGRGADTNGFPMHRMRGLSVDGIQPRDLAQRIVYDVANYSPALNGVMIPFDAGEL